MYQHILYPRVNIADALTLYVVCGVCNVCQLPIDCVGVSVIDHGYQIWVETNLFQNIKGVMKFGIKWKKTSTEYKETVLKFMLMNEIDDFL